MKVQFVLGLTINRISFRKRFNLLVSLNGSYDLGVEYKLTNVWHILNERISHQLI